MGATTAARLKAALELGMRLTMERNHADQIRSPADAANLLMPEMSLLEQEHLRTILLDTKNRVMAIPTIYVGSVNTTMIRVAELFREAIRRNCPALIVLHNHPSGDPTPSPVIWRKSQMGMTRWPFQASAEKVSAVQPGLQDAGYGKRRHRL